MQTLHFSFFFFTATGLASRSGYCTSLINLIFRSLSTSSLTALACLGHNFLCFCFTGLNVGSTFRSCEVLLIYIPGMSYAEHENVWIFCFKKDMRLSLTSRGISFPMLTGFLGCYRIVRWIWLDYFRYLESRGCVFMVALILEVGFLRNHSYNKLAKISGSLKWSFLR